MSALFPIFILEKESREIMRFDSREDAQSYLERIDVENEEYAVWDANARPLRMAVEEPLWLVLEPSAVGPDLSGLLSDLRYFAQMQGVELTPEEQAMAPTAVYEKIMVRRQGGFSWRAFSNESGPPNAAKKKPGG
jgi:hypothetical protein